VSPKTEAGSGGRLVERIVDPRGKSRAVIFARRSRDSRAPMTD